MPKLRFSGGRRVMSTPSSNNRPALGSTKPARIISSVVLPEPDAPSSVRNSPARTLIDTSSSATNEPYRLAMPSAHNWFLMSVPTACRYKLIRPYAGTRRQCESNVHDEKLHNNRRKWPQSVKIIHPSRAPTCLKQCAHATPQQVGGGFPDGASQRTAKDMPWARLGTPSGSAAFHFMRNASDRSMRVSIRATHRATIH